MTGGSQLLLLLVGALHLQTGSAEATVDSEVPAPVRITEVDCGLNTTLLRWEAAEHQNITHFQVEMLIKYDHDNEDENRRSWQHHTESTPSIARKEVVPVKPNALYKFRVSACNWNLRRYPYCSPEVFADGSSTATEWCRTRPDVPYAQPEVFSLTYAMPYDTPTEPYTWHDGNNDSNKPYHHNNISTITELREWSTPTTGALFVNWQSMWVTHHNGPGFGYLVSWRREGADNWQQKLIEHEYNKEYIFHTVLMNHTLHVEKKQPVERYLVKVEAVNDVGPSKGPVEVYEGYVGVKRPSKPPSNFALKKVINSTCAIVTWDPIDPDLVNGPLRGYYIKYGNRFGIWSEKQVRVGPMDTEATLCDLEPDPSIQKRRNFAKILAYNNDYWGPATDLLQIPLPEPVPEPVREGAVFCHQHGSSSIAVYWEPSWAKYSTYSTVRGYNLYIKPSFGTADERANVTKIHTTNRHYLKINHLTPDTRYMIAVTPVGDGGEGELNYWSVCSTDVKSKPINHDYRRLDGCMFFEACDEKVPVHVINGVRQQEESDKVEIDIALPFNQITEIGPWHWHSYHGIHIKRATWFSDWYVQYRIKSKDNYRPAQRNRYGVPKRDDLLMKKSDNIGWSNTNLQMDDFKMSLVLEADTTYEVRVVYVQAEYEVPAPTAQITTDSATLISYALQRLDKFITKQAPRDINRGLDSVGYFVYRRLDRFAYWLEDHLYYLLMSIIPDWLYEWMSDSAPSWVREALHSLYSWWDDIVD